jgi:hypothetical protein
MTTHRGRCHCGNVTFEVEGEIEAALSCNCSICARKGALLWAVPRRNFRLQPPKQEPGRYTFNRHLLAHRFCPICGIHTHAEDVNLSGEPSVYINLRSLDDLDLAALPVQHFDGRSV